MSHVLVITLERFEAWQSTHYTLFTICEEAGLETRREPRDIFSRALPVAALVAAPGQGRPAIIPDGAVRAALPAALTSSASRPSRTRLPLTRLLFDVKTIHLGTSHYQSARARDRRSGAVEERAQGVHPAYLRHARTLDQRYMYRTIQNTSVF